MIRRIYFDNAATSFPKPPAVYQAMDDYNRKIGASAGRGAYREAMDSARIITETRQLLAQLFNAADPQSIIFTFNCSDSLSLAIKGLPYQPGDHVITTRMDHNSVLRPLHRLAQSRQIQVTHVPADKDGLVDPDAIGKAIRPRTRLIAVVHASNVCGSLQDIAAIARIAREHEIPCLIDAAQTAGHVPIDVQSLGIDMMAFPGHKGLLGPLGTGGLYVRPGFEKNLTPLREGGTGSKSENPWQPEFMPDWLESGSHNGPGLAGLHAALNFLLNKGIINLRAHEQELCRTFLDCLCNIKGLKVHGPKDPARLAGAFSVTVNGLAPAELSGLLEQEYGLLTRPGLHCAPFAHQTLGTLTMGGTTRFSLGAFLTLEDIRYAAGALEETGNLKTTPF